MSHITHSLSMKVQYGLLFLDIPEWSGYTFILNILVLATETHLA